MQLELVGWVNDASGQVLRCCGWSEGFMIPPARWPDTAELQGITDEITGKITDETTGKITDEIAGKISDKIAVKIADAISSPSRR